MADQTTESILFEIKINGEQYKAEQALIRSSLQQLALDIEKTRAAQKTLNDARKAGTVSDAEYARQSVKLREELKGQTADQRELEKGLATSQKAYNSAAGSAEQLRAQLFELKTAYYAMSEAERQSTEGQGLQKQALAISDSLSLIEKSVGTASRDVGKYSDGFKQGLAGIVAELVKIQAAQKGVDAQSEAGANLERKRIGYVTAAQRAAAEQGISDFAQAKATIDQYAQAFTPAVENLVKLQQEQQQVGQTVGENSQQYSELGFKMAGAQKALDDLVSAQVAAEKAAQSGAGAAQEQGAATTVAANSLAGLRLQLIALKEQREALDPTTKEAEELSETILKLDTRIQQAAGKIDEFGERVQKNIKKENFDTVNDAIQGLVGTMSAATIVFGDNSDAAKAQAKALQLMALAQDARSIAIGIGSARDAVAVVLMQAKNLFLKEEATLTTAAAVSTEAHAAVAAVDAVAIEAQAGAAALNAESQAASTAGTVANTVATEAQAAATEKATLLQKLFDLALRTNPIGLVIIAISALVGLFAVYRNSSEATQQKIKNFAETLLRFTTPIGLVYTAIEALYKRFESVRKVLDPLINGFKAVAGAVGTQLQSFGEYIGFLDTTAEKVAKLAAAELERANALREQADTEIKLAEATGASVRDLTNQRLLEIAKQLKIAQANDDAQQTLHEKDLARIKKQIEANEKLALSERKPIAASDNKILEEVAKARAALNALQIEQAKVVAEAIERDRAARQQEATDIQTNAQRAVQSLQLRIEQQDAAENAQLQRNISRIALRLSAVQKGTLEELRLQQQQVQAQTALEIKQATDTLAERKRLRAVGYAQELSGLKQQMTQALDAQGLTEQQRTEITADYAQKRADVEQKYSLKAAQEAVKNIPVLRAQANAQELKLRADFERQIGALVLQSQVETNQAQLAQMAAGTVARRDLELKLIDQEQELAIAGLDRRTISNLEYETKVTAIRADAVAKRKALSEQDTQSVITELQAQQQGAELNEQKLLVGHTEGQQLRIKASKQYYNEQLRAEIDNYAAGTAATKAGTTERENVEKQHLINLAAIDAERDANELANIRDKYDKIAGYVTQSISAISTIQDAASQAQLNRIQTEMNAATTSQARKAVLAKQQERIEKEQHERQKKFAIAQALIDGASAVVRILAQVPKYDYGIATAIEIGLAIATTAAQITSIKSQKFAQGGIAQGPSHANGGIQLNYRGRPAGIEIEGGEPVLTAAVSRSPVLLGMASIINQLAGGRALYVDPTPASTWARWAEGGVVSSSPEYLPQIRTGGVVQLATAPIDYEQLTDMMATKLGLAFVNGARALPAQSLNLVELRERNQQLDKQDAQTNI